MILNIGILIQRSLSNEHINRNEENINLHSSSEKLYSSQFIQNPNLDSDDGSWYFSADGDISDVNASLDDGYAKYHVLGDQNCFSLIADPPLALDWVEVDNPDFPNHPDIDEVSEKGFRVSHEWDDTTAIQNPSVHWDRNISLSINMQDYIITSASIQARVNATVDENIDRYTDYYYGNLARNNPNEIVNTYGVGDYIKFYVLVSDLEKNKVYEIASFQTTQIGIGSPPGIDYLFDTFMESVSEDVLIFYLSSVLNTDQHNFTLSVGIRINIEDNVDESYDLDTFNELIINYINLTFTYEKKIDQLTKISWNQIGAQIRGNNIELIDANLNFKYKLDQTWPNFSLNSKLKIIINNYELEKTILLTSINTTFQEISLGKFDFMSYIFINNNLSLSIQLFLADEFLLDRIITLFVDDVSLMISYVQYFQDPPISNDFIVLLLSISFAVIGVLSLLSVKSYVLNPRKKKREAYLIQRAQKFKDIRNIQTIIIIHKPSGLPIYSKNFSPHLKIKNTLFSGFLTAISTIGREIATKNPKLKETKEEEFNKVVELDLKQFHCLILDVEELRTAIILKSISSKRLKNIMGHFCFSLYIKISEILKNWDNNLGHFNDKIPPVINEHFEVFYKEPFVINTLDDQEKVRKKYNLSKLEYQILKISIFLFNEKDHFKLMDILEKKSETREELIINAIEVLIENKIITPISKSRISNL